MKTSEAIEIVERLTRIKSLYMHDKIKQALQHLIDIFKNRLSVEELLKQAREILDDHWFSTDGEYNNDEVIDICNKIDKYFNAQKERENEIQN